MLCPVGWLKPGWINLRCQKFLDVISKKQHKKHRDKMLEWINQGEAAPPTPNCVPLEGPEILLGEGGTSNWRTSTWTLSWLFSVAWGCVSWNGSVPSELAMGVPRSHSSVTRQDVCGSRLGVVKRVKPTRIFVTSYFIIQSLEPKLMVSPLKD